MSNQGGQSVKTTERSIEIIKIIRDSNGASVAELEKEMDMANSAIYKHINTLVKNGFIIETQGEYRLGFELLHLGECARKSNFDSNVIEKYMSELREQVNHVVEFGVESNGLLVVYDAPTNYEDPIPYSSDVYDSNGFHSVTKRYEDKLTDYVGNKAYMHTNAMGKAILAEKPDEKIREIAEKYNLPGQADNTITSIDNLYEEIELIRERGFATTNSEWANGLKEVATSVEIIENRKIGAVSICGPAYAISDYELLNTFPELLSEFVSELEEELRRDN